MSPQWISTDRFRRPRPKMQRQAWQLVLWTVSASLSIAILLFSGYLGSHIYAVLFRLTVYSDLLVDRTSEWQNISTMQPELGHKHDYADITMGARVELAFTSRSYTSEETLFAALFAPQQRAAELVFRSRHEGDGRCWEINGVTGTIAVRLSELLTPTAIVVHQSIQHQLSTRAVMAPRRLAVWTIVGGTAEDSLAESREHKPVGDFLVSGRTLPKDIRGRSVVKVMDFEFTRNSGVSAQVFPIPSSPRTNLMIVEVKENWGGNRTCIQRIAVY
ncbi:hypothetical protein B0H10DRAFT_1965251 [Mycena sp. CBHHK59/15]|nr:hypothetical protein B0H10DRAFT_1965251 [Mycena sp. CBHHK59/15]